MGVNSNAVGHGTEGRQSKRDRVRGQVEPGVYVGKLLESRG